MIGYVTIGTSDLERTAAFFDALLPDLGGARAYSLDRMIAWGFGPSRPLLVATFPSDGQPARAGNGTMVALMATDKAHVARLHRRALDLGATDAGVPSPVSGGFFGGYFRDPDGNKFCVFVMTSDPSPLG
ncbi:VOC family protein [Aestuariivita sp.]|jgi:catechol 2,3-dioxygenase-like lactoylglutathione lyase family enzyme|uniref:VOC family protein n=1 Tax=Aestuariivita sp. TaxID=1872407 RepID=UPI00216FC642|nr:VOC family protein [Aestuariivita sp.]MCE8006844.1 VOC family protein [Aestuariivita sp.]